ncbi:MAG TPA: hypothetical protein VF597_04455 [Candidatus Saccharimonadales bacterium]
MVTDDKRYCIVVSLSDFEALARQLPSSTVTISERFSSQEAAERYLTRRFPTIVKSRRQKSASIGFRFRRQFKFSVAYDLPGTWKTKRRYEIWEKL